MPPFLRWIIALAVLGAAAFWLLTRPESLDAAILDEADKPDPEHGEQVFLAAGCASCHTAPDAKDDGPPVLSGGQRFETGFGTFVAPNISPDPDHGIGAWSDAEIVQAVMLGVSPDGQHYYPAFPYADYGKAAPSDIRDLVAYWRTLPGSDAESQPHDLSFPFTFRRGLGLWKRLFVSDDWVLTGDQPPEVARGRYLAESLGHCGECHTSRNLAGGLKTAEWLGGAPNPTGKGRIPNITPGGLDWSQADIAGFLRTGFTPEFDTAGGEMVPVIEKLGKLPEADTAALAAYLKAVPAID